MNMMISYKFRIYPNRQQCDTLRHHFNLCRWLHNSALEERITAYKSIGKSLSYKEQANQLPEIKECFPQFSGVHSQVLQEVLKRLDLSFKHFFRRIKLGATPGFPRFKGKERFNSICYPQSGFKIIGNRIEISKIGLLKIKLHRRIDGDIKTCSIKKYGNQWYVIFTAERRLAVEKKPIFDAVGIDLGLESFAVISDGKKIENPRHLKKSEARLKEIHSKYSKHNGNGTKKKLSVLYRKVTNQRNDFLHKQSRIVVNKYGLIAYEDLNIEQMVQGRLAKSIYDAGWGKFIAMIKYKAESAGTYAIAVNPRNTSQICSGCGAAVKKELHVRQHECPECGLSIHRDLNASINILRLGTNLRNSVSESTY